MASESVREVALDQWGRALLEELLFRAAESVSAQPPDGASVEVALKFVLTPRAADDALEIRTESSAESPLVTRLRRPF
ncbi:MAG: hypothetical protein FJ091_20160 [Deltaproteobacteria bacterium]|nr:hypothetical protein [Deltaproteobacteria bacterium]